MATFEFTWRGKKITAHADNEDPIPTIDTIEERIETLNEDLWKEFLCDWESFWDSDGNSEEFEHMKVDGDERF